MKQPCLDCGTPADSTRCTKCSGAYDRSRYRQQNQVRKQKGGRPQYSGAWRTYAQAIRQTATICHLCGKGNVPGDPWQADHIIPAADGGGAGPAAAAHRSCNIARANRSRRKPDKQT